MILADGITPGARVRSKTRLWGVYFGKVAVEHVLLAVFRLSPVRIILPLLQTQ